jgi:hypothetical protein
MSKRNPKPVIDQALDGIAVAPMVIAALMALALLVAAIQSVLP